MSNAFLKISFPLRTCTRAKHMYICASSKDTLLVIQYVFCACSILVSYASGTKKKYIKSSKTRARTILYHHGGPSSVATMCCVDNWTTKFCMYTHNCIWLNAYLHTKEEKIHIQKCKRGYTCGMNFAKWGKRANTCKSWVAINVHIHQLLKNCDCGHLLDLTLRR